MAGPTVTLTFAGDTKDLDRAFKSVGDDADGMATRVGDSSKRMSDSIDGSGSKIRGNLDGIRSKTEETADTGETRFQGLADTITGTGDIIQGFKDGSLTDVAGGFADLFGGLKDFVIPTIGTLATTLTTTVIPAVWGFTSALFANPITWIVLGIIALIAIIVLMVTHWDDVKRVVGIVVDWITQRWKDFTGWISGIARSIGGFFSNMWEGMKSGAKAALNWVIDRLNNAVDALNFLIGGINLLPGVSIPYIPHIPRLHQGGVVPGAPGSEMLAVLQAGERVIPADRSGGVGGGTVTFVGNTSDALATVIMQMIRTGQIQISP